ncbi:MAG TPA: TfoX/Sxy family protein [Lentimicrobium sp.]|jgi:DNA transformation protein|nr:TfoX/Sxy family protein [Lentimicrobium sp.]
MTTPTDDLSKMPNIGSTLKEKLMLIGINSAVSLKMAGAENAFIKLKTVDKDACINMLYALEGAIQGIRWHDLPATRKAELKEFFRLTDS